jgi:NADH:ubiquinone oxidoreductase subunit 3 (subunit A)
MISAVIIIIIFIIRSSSSKNTYFRLGIYACIPETKHVAKQYYVAAILSLLFMVPISLVTVLAVTYLQITTF